MTKVIGWEMRAIGINGQNANCVVAIDPAQAKKRDIDSLGNRGGDMLSKRLRVWRAICIAAFGWLFLGAIHAAPLGTWDPEAYVKPECPTGFSYDAKKSECTAQPDAIKAIPKEKCNPPGLKQTDAGVCEFDSKSAPKPACKPWSGYSAKLTGAGEQAKCTYELSTRVSSPGDYVGDCITVPRPVETVGKSPETFLVTNQRELENDDRELMLVPGEVSWSVPEGAKWWSFGCKATVTASDPKKLAASELMDRGATRQGYAYGMLTMPYKYFPKQKAFQVGVPIGAYLGWRSGQAGNGSTFAMAFTLSSVKANTVDPKVLDAEGKPTVTGTTDVAALSGAVGFVFDILKTPRGKPFKAGIFIGQDLVSKDATIDYKFNRKTWMALQVGFDFTDN